MALTEDIREKTSAPDRREVAVSVNKMLREFQSFTLEDADTLLSSYGLEEYDRMQADGQVALCLRLLRHATVSKGIEFIPLYGDESHPLHEESVRQAKFCENVFNELVGQSLRDVFIGMMDSAAKGFSMHEIIWDTVQEGDGIYYGDAPATGKWRVKRLKHKDPATFEFELDEYDNIKAVYVRGKGDIDKRKVPYGKFLHFILHKEYEKPVGKSLLTGAWKWWRLKIQAAKDFAVYLSKFAAPTPRGKFPKGWSERDVQNLLQSLDSFRTQNAIVYPDEAEVDLLEANRGGDRTFIEAFEHADRAIAKAILGSFMATDGNVKERGSQALGNLHYDVFLLSVYMARHQLADTFREHVVKPLCRYNFGDVACPPVVSLGPVEDRVVKDLVEAYTGLIEAGVLREDEPIIRQNLGLPPIPTDLMREIAAKHEATTRKYESGETDSAVTGGNMENNNEGDERKAGRKAGREAERDRGSNERG